jgi:dipeptidase D
LGVINVADDKVYLHNAVRSSSPSRKKEAGARLADAAKVCGGELEVSNEYPGWEYAPESPFRDYISRIFEEMYGKKPEIKAVHAGLECGYFAEKRPGIEMVSIGPDMFDIHTPDEKVSVSSIKRTWEFLLKVIEGAGGI